MAVPKFAPVASMDEVRSYESPEHVPEPWMPDRAAEIEGRQPEGERLGYQGPDQGYILTLAALVRDQIQVAPGESVDDAVLGSINVALRRASLFGRAPVIHDLRIALTIWGWLDGAPSAELVARRSALFEGVANTNHHYTEGRLIADLVPEATLRMTPAAVTSSYAAGNWLALTGA
ncbi:MAG: hypothetical protein ABIR32_18355 [Ilumatobacteraceae bacterium]